MGTERQVQRIMSHFGWSQAQLAREAGVQRQAVNGWINAGKVPAYDALARLAERHRINPEFLRGESRAMFIESPDDLDRELISVLRAFQNHPDPGIRQRFVRMAKAFLDE